MAKEQVPWIRRFAWINDHSINLKKLKSQVWGLIIEHVKNQIKLESPGLTEEHVKIAIDVLLGFHSIQSDVVDNNKDNEIDLVD